MQLENYKLRIFDLAQRWRMNLLTEPETLKLETWFRSLEDTTLGPPLEMSVDAMERRLHQLFNDDKHGWSDGADAPPHPFI
ncbi:MAG TPA: hypothetical protein VIM16_06215 [Mucilaginibacter sp.]|jgi:hypothetical protein